MFLLLFSISTFPQHWNARMCNSSCFLSGRRKEATRDISSWERVLSVSLCDEDESVRHALIINRYSFYARARCAYVDSINGRIPRVPLRIGRPGTSASQLHVRHAMTSFLFGYDVRACAHNTHVHTHDTLSYTRYTLLHGETFLLKFALREKCLIFVTIIAW